MKPARLQLKRTKGYNLQAVSLALNGLPAVKVTRPGPYGNPYRIDSKLPPALAVPAAVGLFKSYAKIRLEGDPHWLDMLEGENLACWCPLDRPCHVDVLLELANPEVAS